MKKVTFLVVMLAVILCCAGYASAKDIIMEKSIKNITFKKDKNGNDYARIFVAGKATLNGITYDRDISIMAFGDNVAKVRSYKKGQTIKLIADEGQYQGRPSYTVLDVVK